MKKTLILVALFTIAQGCTQKNKTMITQNPSITADNIVDELTKQVKHYPSEKIYNFRYENFNCFIEIFVNDILIYKDFTDSKAGSGFDINPCIFKSGLQKVTYKMYPAKDNNLNKFEENTYLTLQLESYDLKNESADDIIYKIHKTPVTIVKDEYGNESELFVATGKDYYEGSFTFEAEVPYELEGFEDAQDLRKMDPKELEKKLINEYAVIKNIYQNKEYDNIAKISFYNLKNQFVAKYDDEKYIKDVWKMLMDAYKEPSFEMQPIENQKMVFFADGKLVALMQSTTDNRLRGNTALWAKVNHDGGLRPMFCNRYFYIPKGKTKFEVY
ncbi:MULTISPECIES: hypothetical protein [Flavobacterium]|uniref:Uncharacterized protein n=1 Tax=Flavobacterium jumunjinense TaxID=998845 RepID=A0ABV5GM64_9FLAO|nr:MULTISPECIES: hypothetical protein [Flavobacterium]